MSGRVTETRIESPNGADDLLTPSLQHRVELSDTPSPWRLSSQVYVAFFGGSLAVTAIALLNARRHAMPRKALILIAVAGLVAFAAVLAVASIIANDGDGGTPSGLRVAVQLISVVGWGPMFLLQRPFDRVFESFGDREYKSLLGPGLLAVLALGMVQLYAIVKVAG